jgi:hypothetical protein
MPEDGYGGARERVTYREAIEHLFWFAKSACGGIACVTTS